MNNVGKVLIKMGLLSLLSVMPLMAQIDATTALTSRPRLRFTQATLNCRPAITRWFNPMQMPIYYGSRIEAICARCSSISNPQSLRFLTATLRSPSTNMGILTISIEFGLKVRNTA